VNYLIRRATPADAGTLVEFNAAMALETEQKTLDRAVLTAGVTGLLQHPDYGFYVVAATDAGEVVGCLMITYEWSDWRNGLFWWVQSVYVTPAQRGQGVYRSLYEQVKHSAQASGTACGFRLYVEEHNDAAQATYRRLGMERTHYLMFEETL
jgi:ribosomal protein S18 acetylase RimI-like enzyme